MIARDLVPLESRLNWFCSSDNLIGSFYLFGRGGATTKERKEEMENVWITRERKYVVRRRLQQRYTKWQSTYSNATWTFDCFSLIGLSPCLDLFFLLSCVTWACARPWVFVTWPIIKAISFDVAGFRSSVYRIFIDRGSDKRERRNRDRYRSSAVSRIIRTISSRSKIYSWALFFLYLYFLFNRVLENIVWNCCYSYTIDAVTLDRSEL